MQSAKRSSRPPVSCRSNNAYRDGRDLDSEPAIGQTALMLFPRAATFSSVAVAVVGSLTAANGLGKLRLAEVAASPDALGEGKAWLLVTSALIADRPWLPSLLGFGIVGCAALSLCAVRVVVEAAVVGHVLSALAVYGLIDLARLLDPAAFASVFGLADYGLSAYHRGLDRRNCSARSGAAGLHAGARFGIARRLFGCAAIRAGLPAGCDLARLGALAPSRRPRPRGQAPQAAVRSTLASARDGDRE